MTPPGSPCSVMFGKGFTTAVPGSVQGTFLVVDDVEAARAEFVARGVNVSELFHFEGNLLRVVETSGRVPGPEPNRASYFSFASFKDPDGNGWLLQEVKTRFPGRGLSLDVATVTALLQETEKRHGDYEPTAPKHHWSDWYAAIPRGARAGADSRGGGQRRRTPHRTCRRPRARMTTSRSRPQRPRASQWH